MSFLFSTFNTKIKTKDPKSLSLEKSMFPSGKKKKKTFGEYNNLKRLMH